MVIEEEATSLKENSVQVNKITKEQMLSNHELKRSLSEITSKSKNQILSVYDSVNQLFIDDTYASQIVSGDYESYNIPAYKINQDSTVLYNVFLEKQLDGTFESYLLSYYYQNNVDADLNQEVISFSKEQLSTNFQINYDFRTCGLSGVTCNCYTLMREYVDLENYVYRWDYVACTNESIDDGDSASGGGIPSNDPPDSNVPSDPIDSNPIDTNPEENQGSNGGSSDGNATIGATDSNCPQSSVPSLGDGRCGSLSEPVFPLNVVSQNTQALFDSLNNPNEIELYNFIQNPQQNELRNNINNFIRSEYNSQEARGFALELILELQSRTIVEIYEQDPYRIWGALTEEEKRLAKKYPIQAYFMSENRVVAFDITEEFFPSNNAPHLYYGINDKKDAFRHAFFNAINTKFAGRFIAEQFSNAHETETPLRWIKEREMDLFNNNVGHNLGESNRDLRHAELKLLVWYAAVNGDLNYLLPMDYNDPNFMDNPTTLEPRDGNHGISDLTRQFSTDQ
jgi:hypothetical protein